MLLKNCRLIGALSDGVDSENGYVRLEGQLIDGLGGGEVLPGEGEEVFDCGGRTLLPGIIDLHTHISGLTDFAPRDTEEPMQLFIAASRTAQRYLDYGVTTIRDAGACLRVNNYVRDGINEGIMDGPNIFSCGYILAPVDKRRSQPLYEIDHIANGADGFRGASREELAAGADYIKIYASGSALNKNGVPTAPIMREEEIAACVEIAEMKGSFVAAHAHSIGAIKSCIRSGVRTIEHATYIDESALEMMAKSEREVYLVPTLAALYQGKWCIGTRWEFLIARLEAMLRDCAKQMRLAYESGFKLGFGTDCTVGMEQYEQGMEFKFRREICGMKELDILTQATRINAEIIGIGDRVGEIKKGLLADLILVDGKPDRDMSVMYSKPVAVWSRGKKVR